MTAGSVAAVLLMAPAPVRAQTEPTLAPQVVTASRQGQRAEDALASVEVIERVDIERAGAASLIDVLRTLPGVRVTANGGRGSNANVYIRGAEARHTLLLVDGLRVGSATSGAPTLETIPLDMIERIEILRGPASALYGSEAIGGVIQVFTRKGETGFHPELFVGYGSEDTFKGSATLSGGTGRLRYSLSAGKERTDGYDSKRDPAYWAGSGGRSSWWGDRDGFRSDLLSGSLSLGFRERDEAGVSFTRTDARNEYDASGLTYFNSWIDKKSRTLGFFLRNELAAGWTSTLRLGRSEDRSLTQASAALPSRFDTRQDQWGWQHDVDLPLGRLLLAYESVTSKLDSSNQYRRNSRRVDSVVAGWTARLGAHDVQINARHDDNSQFGGKTTGLLAYGYDLSPAWRVRASLASAFNAPTFNQLYWPMTSPTSYHGNPDLKPEEALNRELGVRWRGGNHVVELSAFDNKVTGLIANNPEPALRGQQINLGEARLRGLELAYTLSAGAFEFMAGADTLSAKDARSGLHLPRRARHAGFVRLLRKGQRVDWGVEFDGAGRRYDDAANSARLHGYALAGAWLHYRVARDWRIEARADNLLDKDYELARGYRTPGRSAFVGVRYAPR
ncbi:TonB-dependent receptor domain-containing protein [Pseudothauera nasutitermitis]|nr:TonB-dependent receptor [Pseudothauera nasutitermitis]